MHAYTPKVLVVTLWSLALAGCLERELVTLNPCLVSGVVSSIAVNNIDKVDLLFMVDTSPSMKEEQVALRREFPKLIETLTSGVRADGSTFNKVKDLHLGVITSNIGIAGVPSGPSVTGCNGVAEDGLLQHALAQGVAAEGALSHCPPSYGPTFISYTAGTHDETQTAMDFQCLSAVGTMGCGFEQQLEAMLKAVWPAVDIDPQTGMQWVDPETGAASNRITFLGDGMGGSTLGHGDGANAGFLRNDAAQGLSLIALVMVTDEEDCSSLDPSHFNTAADSPYAAQPGNLRCFLNKQNLHSIERYVKGFQALREQDLVIFAAIAGVPTDLVDADNLDFDFTDEVARNQFYANILNDQRMIERIDPTITMPGSENIEPSCKGDASKAFPPRRIVEVAQAFGENGIVQSICQDDFSPAMEAIIKLITDQLGNRCLPRALVRNSDGMVPCKVVWELPPATSSAPPTTPRTCADRPFLSPVEGKGVSESGGAICEVAQLRVVADAAMPDGKGPVATSGFVEGWYYDNYSTSAREACAGNATFQRVTFTESVPTGVTVSLECLNETQSLVNNRVDINNMIEQPSIYDPCEKVMRNGQELFGDAACEVTRLDNTKDTQMYCHPRQQICVLSCQNDADCAAGWVCDNRAETLASTVRLGHDNGTPYCVNPTCGDGK